MQWSLKWPYGQSHSFGRISQLSVQSLHGSDPIQILDLRISGLSSLQVLHEFMTFFFLVQDNNFHSHHHNKKSINVFQAVSAAFKNVSASVFYLYIGNRENSIFTISRFTFWNEMPIKPAVDRRLTTVGQGRNRCDTNQKRRNAHADDEASKSHCTHNRRNEQPLWTLCR